MMQNEFEKLTGLKVSPDTYKKIETVYMWYPGIDNKEQIAELYKQFGPVLINDMYDRATKIDALSSRVGEIQAELNELNGPAWRTK